MIWLGIDTSNTPLSVAIVNDGLIIAEIVQDTKLTHSVTAMPTIEELFEKVKMKPNEIDAIAVSEGPGSYTGIRIGVTIAKTLAWTLKKPLIGISSLKVVAANANLFSGLICSLFDARRQNVYAGVYKGETLETVLEEHHSGIKELLQQLKEYNDPVLFVGLDVSKFEEEIRNELGEKALFASKNIQLPRASKLIELAMRESLPSIEDVHSFVPKYHRLAQAEAEWMKGQKKG